ncbi:MAG: isoprenyl transferase [Hyellaceae cyanobacterium CSU_1_1]|nr:isoprenyl transferase [Hyellaceae cyanobacterium CSU_1_1]
MKELLEHINLKNLPKHLAIIMDGNGRWAKQKGMMRVIGHENGTQSVKIVVENCARLGISHLTLYAFSTENWGRPTGEVSFLMSLFERLLQKELKEMEEEEVCINFIGDLTPLPPSLQQEMHRSMERTKHNQGVFFNVAINYGSRHEMINACKAIAQKVQQGELSADSINDQTISQHLYTSASPDPDLLIRTSGEMRLSNFMLWQLAYTEIYVTETFWPDFDKNQLDRAIVSFQQRDRRFGKVK